MPFPFFEVRMQNGRTATRGQASCSLGHGFEVDGTPEGVFAEWRWDGTQLVACVDRLGFYNLFYCELEDGVMLSSSVLQLLAEGAPSKPDDRALGVFFRIGLYLGEDTPFESIRALPAGGVLTWKDGRLSVTGGPEIVSESPIPRKAAAEGFIDLMHQAVGRALASWKGDVVLPLSGGRDSRHILFEMNEHRRLPSSCVTLNYGVGFLDHEAAPASRLAADLGVRHVIVSERASRYRDLVRVLVATHLCSDEHAQMIQLGDHCAGPHAVIDGIGGDVLSRNLRFSDLYAQQACRSKNYEAVARALILGHCRIVGAFPNDVFDPIEVERRFPEAEAIDYLAKTVQRFESAADPFTAFFFWNRTRREISLVPTAIHADAAAVLCPYLDSDLQRFLASLPLHITRSGRFHDEVIARAFPRFAQVPYDDQLEKRPARTSTARKFRVLADAGLVAAMLLPGLRELTAAVGPRPKGVPPKTVDFLRYYRTLVETLDAERARRLISAADRCAPTRIRRIRAQRTGDHRVRTIPLGDGIILRAWL
jgi:hypothetical protein